MPNSSLLRPSALLSLSFIVILLAIFFLLILDVGHSCLGVHKPVNMQESQIFDFNVQWLLAVDFCQFNSNLISNRINATIYEHFPFCKKVVDFSICFIVYLLSSGIL